MTSNSDQLVIVNLVTLPCPFCGKIESVVVHMKDVQPYRDGESVVRCFPYLSADDRERLVSGICPPCWAEEMGDWDD